jgi:hypothetical protein
MKKYRDRDFGVCPRALCEGQPVVPVRGDVVETALL